MNGNPKVIKALQDLLKSELTAIHQYVAEAQQFANDGYTKLRDAEQERAEDEMRHAGKLMARLVLFGAQPTMDPAIKVELDSDLMATIIEDLQLECDAVTLYEQAIITAADEDDADTRAMLESILHDEVEHVREIEAQNTQLAQMGAANFLSSNL
jgi:bacterioferritin